MIPCKNTRMMKRSAKFLLPVMLLTAMHLFADDGAASIAAGGVVVMSREPRITMAKEVLKISAAKIVVDYDFRNDSDQNITTDVAFPIPDYGYDINRTGKEMGFDDFRLWVNGTKTRYQVEARAFLHDKDFTQMLTSMTVDIASFGHETFADAGNNIPDIQRLTAAQRKELRDAGLIYADLDSQPLWQVRKKYYWRQTFPAHKIVHVRHEYSPVVGSTNSIRYGMTRDSDSDESKDELKTFCIDGRLQSVLQQIADGKTRDAPYFYVDFILTTANTWKTPIEDFALIVERYHEKGSFGDYVSFCWDGPVTKIDADHFSAHVKNLIPKNELRVGFFSVEESRF